MKKCYACSCTGKDSDFVNVTITLYDKHDYGEFSNDIQMDVPVCLACYESEDEE